MLPHHPKRMIRDSGVGAALVALGEILTARIWRTI
jgi:hypothetical protein